MQEQGSCKFNCLECGASKEASDFYIHKGRQSKLCKACTITRSRAYLENRTKKCTVCGEIKPLNMFRVTRHKPFIRRGKCRFCEDSNKSREWRTENRNPEGRKSRILMKKKVMLLYLTTHPCVECGEADFRVLDFDHRKPEEKAFTISQGLGGSYGLHRIMEEMEKCDVRCANCHRKRTAKQENWNWLQLVDEDMNLLKDKHD